MEVATSHRTIEVVEPSQPSAARYLARELADAAGFSGDDVHRAGIVATELGTNLVKHAHSGQLLGRVVSRGPVGEIEILAVDRGPGVADLNRSLTDGYSTAGSPGTGLGAVRRLSDTFGIHSDERGTVVVARLRASRRAPDSDRPAFELGAVSVAKPGEEFCGDAWTARRSRERLTLLLADGLGHGLHAAEAAEAVVAGFRSRHGAGSVEALQAVHAAIRHTRGAAAAVAAIERQTMVVRCTGIGNISTAVCHDGTIRHAVSHNGTLGHDARVFREYAYPWFQNGLLVMHSDGISSHWTLDTYRGVHRCHPAVIAALLYRDHNRGRDDATVIVAREAR
jgi:anti-sigma regulatory factor (Ser/Thr protein kinase)